MAAGSDALRDPAGHAGQRGRQCRGVGATGGAALAVLLGLSPGGIFLLAVLGSSASYIAVPAAMAVALPRANASVSITLSLAITFPFNVLVAIPVYLALVQHWS